jgi:hypothetical protein
MKHWINKFTYVLLGAVIASSFLVFYFHGLFKYFPLEKTLQKASSKQYDYSNYNCVNFSKDAVSMLHNQGIGSNIIVIQKQNSNNTHALISVWFDPQTGKMVSVENYIGEYNELKNKFGWVSQ